MCQVLIYSNKNICVGKPDQSVNFLGPKFVALSSKVYSNIYLILFVKRENNVFIYMILHFCISHDFFLPESNAKI